jgi:hypothetical protein
MASIDIGMEATNRSISYSSATLIGRGNPANASGKITSVEIYAYNNLQDCQVATFYETDTNEFSTRDYEAIGTVTAGSKQTFTVDLDVAAGDYIGIYFSGGAIDADGSGDGFWYKSSADYIPCTEQAFTFLSSKTISLYGTGSSSKEYSQSVGGSFSSTGSISKATTKTFSGAFSFAGSISKAISKTLSGNLDFSGALTRLRIYFKTLSGEFSFSGGITQKAIGKALTGTVGFTGIIQRAITKTLTGTLNFTGIVSKGIYKTISGVLSFTGGITNKAISKVMRGSLSMTAKVLYWFEKIFGSVSWTEETKSDESWTELTKSDENWTEL